jgi:hypothetical protein
VATPKIIIDMMLMEKYHWTPQQIDEIPKTYLEMLMIAMNQKLESEAGISKSNEIDKEIGIGSMRKAHTIGNGGIRMRVPV